MNVQYELDLDAFVSINRCPSCKSKENSVYGKVYSPLYKFPVGIIRLSDFVEENRLLLKCSKCDLLYHQIIPSNYTIKWLNEGDEISVDLTFCNRRHTMKKVQLVKNLSCGKRILDVGCGTGDFLSNFKGKFEIWGIEPQKSAGYIAKSHHSINLIDANLEDAKLESNFFYAITMFDVIEHIRNVRLGLTKIYNSLKKNGILIIETGNYSSLPARILHSYWWYFSLLDHFVFWNKRVLIRKPGHPC